MGILAAFVFLSSQNCVYLSSVYLFFCLHWQSCFYSGISLEWNTKSGEHIFGMHIKYNRIVELSCK
jgi:hypothetical protein